MPHFPGTRRPPGVAAVKQSAGVGQVCLLRFGWRIFQSFLLFYSSSFLLFHLPASLRNIQSQANVASLIKSICRVESYRRIRPRSCKRGHLVVCTRRSGCFLLLIGWDERLGDEGFERRRRRVTGRTGFEWPHVS